MTIVIDREKFFRPAGFRLPKLGENYIGSDGHVKTCTTEVSSGHHRTILRQIIFVDESAIEVKK